jgi:hypothetical protein
LYSVYRLVTTIIFAEFLLEILKQSEDSKMLLANTLCQRRETQEAKTNKSGGMLRMKEQNLANKMEKITQDQVGLGKRLTSWTPYKIIRKAPNAEICPQIFSFSVVEQNSSMVLFKSL